MTSQRGETSVLAGACQRRAKSDALCKVTGLFGASGNGTYVIELNVGPFVYIPSAGLRCCGLSTRGQTLLAL